MSHSTLKILFSFVGVSLLVTSAQAQLVNDQASGVLTSGVFVTGGNSGSLQTLQQYYRQETGYRVPTRDVGGVYFVKPNVPEIFNGAESLRTKLAPEQIPTSFRPIVADIEAYINSHAVRAATANNKISNHFLAGKIARLSFCFGTDPYAVTAQIEAESKFDQYAVSPTGAVGLTQMTSVAIDEVNDQLGSRANQGAVATNTEYFAQAISCYTGGLPFATMFSKVGGMMPKGTQIRTNARQAAIAKKWLRANIDRQLVYGQVALKIYLGLAHSQGLSGLAAYKEAMKNYNGDVHNGNNHRYSNGVMAQINSI